jgi:hypothetical protein
MATPARDLEDLRGLSCEAVRNVETLTLREAEGVLQYSRRVLRFDRLRSLTPEVATVLVRHRGKLGFDGLRAISPQVASILARHRGPALHLNGLREITEEIATELAKHPKDLFLVGLETPSDQVARLLGKHRGRLFVGSWCRLPTAVGGLNVLQPGDETLRRILQGPLQVAVHMWPTLAAWEGDLELGLTELSEPVAQHLASHKGDLHLSGLKFI